jgi:hypothetical protein
LPTGALSLACDLAVFRDGPALGVSGTYGARIGSRSAFARGTLLVGETEGILDAAGFVKVGIERGLGSFRDMPPSASDTRLDRAIRGLR